jgi:hypothetical protein
LQSHKNTSQNETSDVRTLGVILARVDRGRRGVENRAGRTPTVASHALEELEDLTKAVEVEEVIRPRREIALGWGGIVGAGQGDGGMPPVGESDDEIRVNSPAEPNDLDSLSAERMMRMGDGDESQRWLG